jgi:hypothetical protein
MSANAAAEPLGTLVTSLGLSVAAYSITARLIPRVGPDFVKRGLCGVDMLKGHGHGEERPGGTGGKGPEL